MQRSAYLTTALKGVFVGSGSDGMQCPEVVDAILKLTTKSDMSKVVVSYIGTATYDLEGPRINQTKEFIARGCEVHAVEVGDPHAVIDNAAALCAQIAERSDVVIVSGGNTLFARKRWEKIGLVDALRAAAVRGCVLSGGSAGLIAWFDGGHSDSMDPDTYRRAMVKVVSVEGQDESSGAPTVGEEAKAWQYIRVSGVGFLPGLACPHYDRTQSNGVPRHEDFAKMRTAHVGESAIGVDHWAALVVCNGEYEVLSLPNKSGSMEGKPWVFSNIVSGDGVVKPLAPIPAKGRLEDILGTPVAIVVDPLEEVCAAQNPA